MIRGFYSAGAGLTAQQTALDNTANNMANINTTGYKKQDLNFSELLYSNIENADGTTSQDMQVGNGIRVSQVNTINTQGGLEYTGNTLDFALTSDGYFGVLTQNGDINYTRDGSFHISSEDTGNYLVTASGDYVADSNGNKILLESADSLSQIGVFNFSNPYGLTKSENNLLQSTASSGNAFAVDGKYQNGYLELSNVDMATEMTDLISIQKAYQFNASFIKTADEIENITNNLR